MGAGYEQVVAGLGRRPGGQRGTERDTAPRQFIFGDGAGGVERIRIDLSGNHLDHLRAVMDTTPDGQRDSTAARAALPEAALPHAPEIPSEFDFVAVDGSTMPSDEEFERAAEFELGLTEDDYLDAGALEGTLVVGDNGTDDGDGGQGGDKPKKKHGREDAA